MSLMVSVSGIRGIVGEDLTPLSIVNYVAAFLRVLGKPSGKILIGRDTRKSGIFIEKIVDGTVNALGFDTVKIGVAPTPTILLATVKLGCCGGIAITASHNPSQWNALKFCDERGLFLADDQIENIKKIVLDQTRSRINWKSFDEAGMSSFDDRGIAVHTEEVLKFLEVELIKKMRFKVAIDPVGGTGTVIDRDFLEELGCTVFGIHENPEVVFPRGPEPVSENLEKLSTLVLKRGAHIGFAQDPDGDRLSVVSERGVPIGEEYTLALAGEAYLNRKKTDIVCNLSTSMMFDDLAGRHGVDVVRTRIGEIHVTKALLDRNLAFGGEGNGGVIVIEINPCRDSIVAMGLILELMARSCKSVSRIVKEWPAYSMKKQKVVKKVLDPGRFNEEILENAGDYFSKHSYNTLDGIKFYNNEEWLHIRVSNTEPVVRVLAESKNEKRTDELLRLGKRLIAR